MPSGSPFSLLVTSFLVGSLRYFGPWFAPSRAAHFLRWNAKEREVYLPFFYHWLDERPRAQDQALRLIRAQMERDQTQAPRVFHGPFFGRRLSPYLYWRNLCDPRYAHQHGTILRRECAFLGRLRREFSLPEQILYVLHLGVRHGGSAVEALRTAVEAVRPSLESAKDAGVVLALENVADRLGDESAVGGSLPEIEDALGALGGGTGTEAPVGWTFDIAHALLRYRGDVSAVRDAVRPLLSSLVHLHVNAPRVGLRDGGGWGDRHEAPLEDAAAVWELFRQACAAPRFQRFRTITYEVSWRIPGLGGLFGGSPLPDVFRGYDLVRHAAAAAFESLDEARAIPYPRNAERNAAWGFSGAGGLAHSGQSL